VPELALFAALNRRLGEGESAAIAAAAVRGAAVALDDGRAKKQARRHCPAQSVLDTAALVVLLIRGNVIDIATADTMKLEWEKVHRFRLPFKSFSTEVT
jgi:predicted nucleic acid-binding protein